MGVYSIGLYALWIVSMLAIGIGCLILKHDASPTKNCGGGMGIPILTETNTTVGHLFLDEWVFGTGVAYTAIGCLDIVTAFTYYWLDTPAPTLIVLFISWLFVTAWSITGAASVGAYTKACLIPEYPIYTISIASVVIGFFVLLLTIIFYTSAVNENDGGGVTHQ